MTGLPELLAQEWFTTPVQVQRLTGSGAYGPVHAAAVEVLGAVDARVRLVRDPTGAEVTSSTTVVFPGGTDVPVGSLVTLPASHGARTATVLAVGVYDAGRADVPATVEVMVQ